MSATEARGQRGHTWAARVPCWGLATLVKRLTRWWPPCNWIQVRLISPPIEKPITSRI